MPIVRFPDPKEAGPDGLLAVGGDLHPISLMNAYRQGIFPWPIEEGEPLLWFSPPERGVLDFSEIHIPKSLKKFLKKNSFRISFDEAFDQVIEACASGRPTWITNELTEAYKVFHREGHAHSVEVWDGDELVGGLYGVESDGSFTGESMFHLRPNTSKLALLKLAEHLQTRGLHWMDIQVMTPHMKALGAKLIPRKEFLNRLVLTRSQGLRLFD